ncbi:hypothetical protein SISSUDRAFT_1058447 [Sistotremastrum suecicum HHB10207 ss-3]|uniref:Uncharacterized protein n=1 Tax=Sistotremastrum suecicum HHB10207 ss-3 TaxID=1314776 RepID=A0A166HG46_9AGAM|nr:hypothetical protein SISSUDRAFT_1058447 [Sistotremastrum suecicum HHB10207 ss-3]
MDLVEDIPTHQELLVSYPPQYDWQELKNIIASGDLGLLKRHRDLQARYDLWSAKVREAKGSTVRFLLEHRLHWDKDTLDQGVGAINPPYFTPSIPEHLVKIVPNDWPYSVPLEVVHSIIWTRLPVVHAETVDPEHAAAVYQDGLWGFSGGESADTSASLDVQSSDQVDIHPTKAASFIHQFVVKHWPELEWETAWFWNPPRLQSVPGLAHIHVFARPKF